MKCNNKTLNTNYNFLIHLLIAALFIVLIGCSGGGGSSGGSPQSPNPSTPSNPAPSPNPDPDPAPSQSFDELVSQYESNDEYQDQWGLAAINASSAYARGATGKGIVIGITDSGLDTSHDEIAYSRVLPESNLTYSNYDPTTSQQRHGTMVASVAAGTLSQSNSSSMHGVAFDAEILFTAIQLAEPDDDYDPVDLGDTDTSPGEVNEDFTGIDNFFSSLFEIYNVAEVDIVNNSYGYSGNVIDYTESQIRSSFPKTIEEMAQISTPDSEKTIYVWAAGNAGSYADDGVDFSSPELLPGMSVYISEIQNHSIAVVSIDEDGEISDFSNLCGIAADFCIAAPGGDITVAYPVTNSDQGIYDDGVYSCEATNNCFAVANGTSFASPFVAGGLAVIAEYFDDQLGSTEIVQRMFATANKSGIYANKEIYGQGLLDLNAATAPVGELSASSSLLDSSKIPLANNLLNISNISISEAITSSTKDISFIVFDELNAPFRVPLSSLIQNEVLNSSINSFNSSNLQTSSHTEKTKNGLLRIQFKESKFKNSFNNYNPLQEAIIDQSQAFSYNSDQNNFYLSSGMNFDSHSGLKLKKELQNNYTLKTLITNPWAGFTEKGLSFGRSFFYKNYSIDVVNSVGKNKKIDPFANSSSSNHALVFDLSNPSKTLSFQYGVLKEKDGLNGLTGSGIFNPQKNSFTKFAGLNFAKQTTLGLFVGSIYQGNNPGRNNTASFSNFSKTKSEAYSFGFQPLLESYHKLVFSVSQPLKVTRGFVDLELPSRRTKNKELLFTNHRLDLSSSSTEINSKISYELSSSMGRFGAILGYKVNPYHSDFYNDYWYASLTYSKSY